MIEGLSTEKGNLTLRAQRGGDAKGGISHILHNRLGRQPLSPALVAVAAVMVLLGTLYFASLRPGYSYISNTISELGETGAPQAHAVAFGLFLHPHFQSAERFSA